MLFEDARRLAKQDADQYNQRVFVIYDKLNEDSDDLYTYCGELAMDIMHPEIHKDFYTIVETIEPRSL